MEQMGIFLMQPLMQRFDVTPGSYLATFRQRYSPGTPVLLEFELMPAPAGANELPSVGSLVVSGVKFRDRDQLTRKDLEFDFARLYFPETFDPAKLETPDGLKMWGVRSKINGSAEPGKEP